MGLIAYLEQKARFVREKKKPVLVGLCVLAWCASLLGFGEIIAVVYPIFGYLSIVFIVCMVVHFVQCRKKEKATRDSSWLMRSPACRTRVLISPRK